MEIEKGVKELPAVAIRYSKEGAGIEGNRKQKHTRALDIKIRKNSAAKVVPNRHSNNSLLGLSMGDKKLVDLFTKKGKQQLRNSSL